MEGPDIGLLRCALSLQAVLLLTRFLLRRMAPPCLPLVTRQGLEGQGQEPYLPMYSSPPNGLQPLRTLWAVLRAPLNHSRSSPRLRCKVLLHRVPALGRQQLVLVCVIQHPLPPRFRHRLLPNGTAVSGRGRLPCPREDCQTHLALPFSPHLGCRPPMGAAMVFPC